MGLVSGQPSNLSRRYFGKAVGDASLTGLSPGWQVAGISVDNYSGSWLLVEPIHLLIPPYVLGWATPVSPANATVEITYVPGPGGFLGTTAGAPAVVTLTGYPVAGSPGVPFVGSQQTPVEAAAFVGDWTALTTLIACPPTQRIRLYSTWVNSWELQASAYQYLPMIIQLGWGGISSLGSGAVGILDLTTQPNDRLDFLPNGLDGPLGVSLKCLPQGVFTTTLALGSMLQGRTVYVYYTII